MVALTEPQLHALCEVRAVWQDATREHRFYSPMGQTVDVLAAGPELVAEEALHWPSGHEMSLAGFDLAFAHAQTITVEQITFELPSAPALCFLKLRAWLDRPAERDKDLRDIARLSEGYIGEVDERRWDGEVPPDVEFEDVSAYLLGRDVAAICEDRHLPHVEAFLAKVTPARLAAQGPWGFEPDECADKALTAFRRGMND